MSVPIAKISTETARAKINLTLHIGRVIGDPSDPYYGYHPLDSLVVFADVGDRLRSEVSDVTSLHIDGPFGAGLEADERNLILKAYKAVALKADIPPLKFTLTKVLPVASGIGGGSADAAAALRILMRHAELSADEWQVIALSLGADVPVCVMSSTAHMSGIGGDLHGLTGLGSLQAVLVNPGVAVSTGAVFKAFDTGHPAWGEVRETPRPQLSRGDLLARAKDGRNDLQPPATAQQPLIQTVLEALSRQEGCALSRMSGSGATCFGLFSNAEMAKAAANAIAENHPDWWVVPTVLGEG
ncbi:4-(cytidine 5'-diphospho)-2-C-methyl-D-erythritol kinase [Fretibacter rubidus]|uniref:4-(cytidine 5'-diphospho)-2-C-methyl-D-erythritol kinase n=1 Tax=Fretibacter rubidus TaxID=570162 RepID=UPI00352B8E1D